MCAEFNCVHSHADLSGRAFCCPAAFLLSFLKRIISLCNDVPSNLGLQQLLLQAST